MNKSSFLVILFFVSIEYILLSQSKDTLKSSDVISFVNPYPSNQITIISEVSTGKILFCDNSPELFKRKFLPGSIFKIPISICAIINNFDTNFIYNCKGKDSINGVKIKCWNSHGHGKQKFLKAFSNSCNLYFRTIANSISTDSLIDIVNTLGMNYPSGLDGDPNPYQKISINPFNVLGGSFNMSPIELSQFAIKLAKRGTRFGKISLSDKRFDILYKSLHEVVINGTASNRNLIKYKVSGKTGTVDESMGSAKRAGWFIGFMPTIAPKYAICTLKENSSGHTAALISGKQIDFYFRNLNK